LGGDRLWFDRFVAEHSAVLYYWLLVAIYALAPRQAYRFSELVELHAFDSYDQFCKENDSRLKEIPPPLVAARYYRSQETLYMFDGFQDACAEGERRAAEAVLRAGEEGASSASSSLVSPSSPRPPRRPPCNNLYDVFINIRDDEAEHVVTMKACADDAVPEL
jgi:ubiquinol oxidase